MKGFITKAATIGSKILEVLHWVLALMLIVLIVLSAAAPSMVNDFLTNAGDGLDLANLTSGGFGVSVVGNDGSVNTTALIMFCVASFLGMVLTAMIFRNVYLILTKSKGGSPFTKDNVRMVKEIGIFSIAMPVIGFVMSIITRLVCGVEVTEISVNFSGLMIGLVVLCLTQFFAHGVSLEEDVEGLL